MATKNPLRDRYQRMMERVAAAAEKAGRSPKDIVTVAVTKTATPDQIRQILELGHPDLGESRVQQLQQRVAMAEEFMARRRMMGSGRPGIEPQPIRWHMVGHLQRNKVKPILPLVKLVHSVDSLRLAEEIQAQAVKADLDVGVLLQVNVAGEDAKHGLALPAVSHLADQIQTMAHLKLRGLMCMAPHFDDPEDARGPFTRLHEQFVEMRNTGEYGKEFNILSMGMSNDFEMAIACGANVVRIGRALFEDPDAS